MPKQVAIYSLIYYDNVDLYRCIQHVYVMPIE